MTEIARLQAQNRFLGDFIRGLYMIEKAMQNKAEKVINTLNMTGHDLDMTMEILDRAAIGERVFNATLDPTLTCNGDCQGCDKCNVGRE